MSWLSDHWDRTVDFVKDNPAALLNPTMIGATGATTAAADAATGGYIGETINDLTGKTGEEAAIAASNASAAAELQKLNYLKEINKLPQEYKEKALTQLASIFGIGGDTSGQQNMINQAKASPLYSEIMGGLQSGEESIMRNAAMTGGLRSGNTQGALADYATQLRNKALSDSYGQQLSGLTGLAGLNTNESGIANSMSNIGQIQSQGILGAAQSKAAGTQNTINTLLGLGGLFI